MRLAFWRKKARERRDGCAQTPASPAAADSADAQPSADQPITAPTQDFFGLDPFARNLATAIASMGSQEGFVIGVHGRWGSGKSSAINLVKHHLKSLPAGSDLTVVDFTPWWFTGPDALAMAFFGELGAAMERSLTDEARAALRSLGARLGSAAPVVGTAVELATGVKGTKDAAAYLGNLLSPARSVVREHEILAAGLRRSRQRFLVVIDDLDRLDPDEALMTFKLVKSVGRLPNVTYLLIFDRQLAEAAVAQRFPSEGPHFLEKIVQVAFDLPPPASEDLRDFLLEKAQQIMGDLAESQIARFVNVFQDAVAPLIARPRDVVRLTSGLKLTWPAVGQEVDRADFLAMEAMRLFLPAVHGAVHDNKAMVCGTEGPLLDVARSAEECDRRLLAAVPPDERPMARRALLRLFPQLAPYWDSHHHDADEARARVERRVCVAAHFDTYFRFAMSEATVSAQELRSVVANAAESQEIQAIFRTASGTRLRRGGTKAAILLDELTEAAETVAEEDIGPLLGAIFAIADELDLPEDKGRGFADNMRRLHWLVNRLVRDRLPPPVRGVVLLEACERASSGWLVEFAVRCIGQHRPSADSKREAEPLVTAADAEGLRQLALLRLESAADDGSLLTWRDPVEKLLRWRDLIGDGGEARVREWLALRLADDRAIIALASSFVTHGWMASMGDRVSQRFDYVSRGAVRELVDAGHFLQRVGEIQASTVDETTRTALTRFEQAWANPRRGEQEDQMFSPSN